MKTHKILSLIVSAALTVALAGTISGCNFAGTSSADSAIGESSSITSSAESVTSSATESSSNATSSKTGSNKKQSNNTASSKKNYITKADFDKISNGMTYEEVKKIIGCDGELMSEVGSKGEQYYTVVYNWKGKDGISNAVFEFQDNKLIAKSQVGLR